MAFGKKAGTIRQQLQLREAALVAVRFCGWLLRCSGGILACFSGSRVKYRLVGFPLFGWRETHTKRERERESLAYNSVGNRGQWFDFARINSLQVSSNPGRRIPGSKRVFGSEYPDLESECAAVQIPSLTAYHSNQHPMRCTIAGYVPEFAGDREIALAAVKQNGRAIQHVASELKDHQP